MRQRYNQLLNGGMMVGGMMVGGVKQVAKEDMGDWMVLVSKYGVRGAKKIRDVGQQARTAAMIRRLWMSEDDLKIEPIPTKDAVVEMANELLYDGMEPEDVDNIIGQFGSMMTDQEIADIYENRLFELVDTQASVDKLVDIRESEPDTQPDLETFEGSGINNEQLKEVQAIKKKNNVSLKSSKSKSKPNNEQSKRMKKVQEIRKKNNVSLKEAWQIYKNQ